MKRHDNVAHSRWMKTKPVYRPDYDENPPANLTDNDPPSLPIYLFDNECAPGPD